MRGARGREREREGGDAKTVGRGRGRRALSVCATLRRRKEREKKEEEPGERNAHNAVISVFDLRISLWGYYVGTLSLSPFRCVYSRARARGGRFYFTRIIIPLEDRGADSSSFAEPRREANLAREPRLFMDGFSFNFRQGLVRFFLSLSLSFSPYRRRLLRTARE